MYFVDDKNQLMEIEIINGKPIPATINYINAFHKFKKPEFALINIDIGIRRVGNNVYKNLLKPIETKIIY